MQIYIIKSGTWAYRGVEIINIKKGIQNCEERLAKELMSNGWATSYIEDDMSDRCCDKYGHYSFKYTCDRDYGDQCKIIKTCTKCMTIEKKSIFLNEINQSILKKIFYTL